MTMEGKEVFRRAVRITVGLRHQRAWSGPSSPPTTSPSSSPIRPTCASSRRPRRASGSPWTASPSSSTGRATPRAASIPLALADAADAGRLRVGDHVLLSGFGAGMAWASTVMRWAVDTVDSHEAGAAS